MPPSLFLMGVPGFRDLYRLGPVAAAVECPAAHRRAVAVKAECAPDEYGGLRIFFIVEDCRGRVIAKKAAH